MAMMMTAVIALAAACGTNATTTNTGGGNAGSVTTTRASSGTSSTAASGSGTTSSTNGTTGGTAKPSTTPTTCVAISTIAPRPGEPQQPPPTLACGPVTAPTSSTTYVPTSGPVTTHPSDNTPTTFVPDATHGVLHGTLVQQVMCVTDPCPPQPISGKAEIWSNPTDGEPGTVVMREVGEDGQFTALLAPGTYTVTATSGRDKTCPKTSVTITAGQTTTITIECPF